ncbi:MAG: helix-turn-helix domain-containing protein [Chitinophagaceae bacterium]|nr:helix-turn-helix domain-containing protein [Chitinophagaceae bacterium]
MKLVKTQMTPLIKSFLHIEKREQPFLYSPYHGRPTFHAHPELELTYILQGHGKRIVGNNIAPYVEGDMAFIGSNLPHIWLSDPAFYQAGSSDSSKVIVAYINLQIFEQMFEMLPELGGIKEMTRLASRGFKICGETKLQIAGKLENLLNASGYAKIEGFMSILHIIATSEQKEFISCNRISAATHFNSDRLVPVIQYIKNNISSTISLNTLADLAYMAVPSFCRFFKGRMGVSPLQYILEERMVLAQRLLIELDKPVYEIAGRCGYNSDSHFCKIFKAHFGISPHRYKSNVMRISNLAGI